MTYIKQMSKSLNNFPKKYYNIKSIQIERGDKMNYKKTEIKKGISLHTINTDRFKTNLMAMFVTTPLSKDNITKNTLLNLVLRRGSRNMPSQEEISMCLEEMYGASFDCGVEKTGENHVMKFYMEVLNDEYLPEGENIFTKATNKLFEIVFDPLTENNGFKEDFLNGEKNSLEQIINSKKDNKGNYALDRCIEEMYKDKPYGLYKYGYVEDIEEISKENLYEHYKKLISEAKIDIFVSGKIEDNILGQISENENIKKLKEREANYIIDNQNIDLKDDKKESSDINIVEEKMDVMQGKLVLGLDIDDISLESKYIALVYNTILGGTANSKLFQNVREKANLAYVAGSNYLKSKNNIFVRAGIEIGNYEKALNITKEQIKDMEKGNFSDEDVNNAKQFIISTIKGIPNEQDAEITYYLGQELSNTKISIEEYINKIESVTFNDIKDLANKVNINIIYFLRN